MENIEVTQTLAQIEKSHSSKLIVNDRPNSTISFLIVYKNGDYASANRS